MDEIQELDRLVFRANRVINSPAIAAHDRQVKAEIKSGVPCHCCGVKLRPLILQGIAQVLAQRIFLQHTSTCDTCKKYGFVECHTGSRAFRNLPADYRQVLGRKVIV